MADMHWELDDPAAAGTLYSRAVVGEMCPGALSPLTATGGIGAELGPAWLRAYRDCGLGTGAEGHHPVLRFGSHLYLDTSLLRQLGEYAAGGDPMAFARQYLAERPDVPRRRDEQPVPGVAEDRLDAWTESTLSPGGMCPEDPGGGAAERRGARPDLAASSDAALVARFTGLRGELQDALLLLARAELGTAVSSDLLASSTEGAGHPALNGALVAGYGGMLAEPVVQLWALGRQVARSVRLPRLFEQGITAVAEQVEHARGGEMALFRSGLNALLARYGHLGPAEWELNADTWETDPRLVLRILDDMRLAADHADPLSRARRSAERSVATASAVRASIGGSARATADFELALHATRHWLRHRERFRQVVAQVHHEQRLAVRELGRRQVGSGVLDNIGQVFMLLGAELPAFVAEPAAFGETLRMREYDFHALARYQPPFVTVGPPGPVVGWSRRRDALPLRGRQRSTLPGTATSAGTATGRARVLADPARGHGLRPGDVLVLPSAGPSWVPLLTTAVGVVTDSGGALSDVSIACRDLGIPCVVGTVDATSRIVGGAEITVDGGAGAVYTSRPDHVVGL
ncbi:MAG: rifampicin phosphotransferase [Pseudonocardiales bacterium]|nr:phosphoenolpyruvate-utilizing protein [Pseudonocardia sp.]MDT7610516.1 rifampicin phosphotransferase [Pseudonocardiales bacterium]MDT7619725.1 rifampicin phosphotransferase [Pseudonocardiales bacterium]MDT7634620.1 rifampicin phosphotransferase [Pseudonocardiales bacterium]